MVQHGLAGPLPDTDPEQNMIDASMGSTNYLGDLYKRQAEAEKAAQVQVDYSSSDNMVTVKGPPELINEQHQKAQAFDHISQLYEKRLAQNEARLAYQQQHPWGNVLAQIASSLAANDPNPITRSIGQAAQRLNPSAAELQAQEGQILQGMAQYEGHRAQMQATADYRKRTAEEKAQKDKADLQTKVLRRLEIDAANRRFVPDEATTIARMVQSKAFTEDEAREAYDYIKATKEGALGRYQEERGERIEDKEKVAKFQTEERNRLARLNLPIDEAKIAYRAQKGVEAQQALEPMKQRLATWAEQQRETFASNKPFLVPSEKDMQTLEDVAKTKLYADDVFSVLKDPKYSQYFGQIRLSRLTESNFFKALRPDEQQYVMTLMAHERPRVVGLSGAGVRGYSKAEWPILKDLGGDPTYSPAQMEQVLKLLIKSSNERASAVVQARPLANQELLRSVVGDDVMDVAGKPKSSEKASAPAKKPVVPPGWKIEEVK